MYTWAILQRVAFPSFHVLSCRCSELGRTEVSISVAQKRSRFTEMGDLLSVVQPLLVKPGVNPSSLYLHSSFLYQVFRPFLNKIRIWGSVIFETFAWKASCITTYRLGYTYSLPSVCKLIILYETLFLLLNTDLNTLNVEWAQFYKKMYSICKQRKDWKYIFKWILSDTFFPSYLYFSNFLQVNIFSTSIRMCIYGYVYVHMHLFGK